MSGSEPDATRPDQVGQAERPLPAPEQAAGEQAARRSPTRRAPRPARRPKQPRPRPAIPERTPDPDRLIVGRIVAAQGAHGDFRMAVLASHPEHLEEIEEVYLGDEPEARRLLRVRFRGDEALLRVEGLTSPADVVERRGRLVRIDRAAAPELPEGEYYHYELIGLDVVDTEGRPLGRLAEIIETGANDVYVVIGPEGELLFPAIEEVVLEVDPAAGRMVVKPQEYY